MKDDESSKKLEAAKKYTSGVVERIETVSPEEALRLVRRIAGSTSQGPQTPEETEAIAALMATGGFRAESSYAQQRIQELSRKHPRIGTVEEIRKLVAPRKKQG
jgi:hypothetical protein